MVLYMVLMSVVMTLLNAALGRISDQTDSSFYGIPYGFHILSVIIVALRILGALGLSSRIAGPFVRLGNHMQDVQNGIATEPLKFRDSDFFHEIADRYNSMLAKLKRDGFGK